MNKYIIPFIRISSLKLIPLHRHEAIRIQASHSPPQFAQKHYYSKSRRRTTSSSESSHKSRSELIRDINYISWTDDEPIPARKMRKVWKSFCDELGRIVFLDEQLHKQLLALQIPKKKLKLACLGFYDKILSEELEFLPRKKAMYEFLESKKKFKSMISTALMKYMALFYERDSAVLGTLVKEASFMKRHEEYVEARNLHRDQCSFGTISTVIAHLGPTNSGKTHTALERLKQARTGIYCGPLRLLAHEVFEKLNRDQVPCNLITGEEQRETEGAQKWASTIEMAQLDRRFDVGVIDEIQMIADQDRGWAWMQAFLGLQSSEIHVCGDPAVRPLLERICKKTGDTLVIKEYKRLAGLSVEKTPFASSFPRKLQRGDCVVAFSRKKLFALKRQIESLTGLKVAIIYGSLPPETRTEQARLFNEGMYDVLVASDAIGMGLNLNIRRIIFETLMKFDGEGDVPLDPAHVKQIGGRAGRYKSAYPNGTVTAISPKDLKILKECMHSPSAEIHAGVMSPTLQQLQIFSSVLPSLTFSALLSVFEAVATLDHDQTLCKLDDQKRLAELIESLPLSLPERHRLIAAPVKIKDHLCEDAFVYLAECIARNKQASVDDVLGHMGRPKERRSDHVLSLYESQHRIVILYLWLSSRYPQSFPEYPIAFAKKQYLETEMNNLLQTMSFGRPIPAVATEVTGLDDIDDTDDIDMKTESVEFLPYIPPPTSTFFEKK